MKSKSLLMQGFIILFALAFISRFFSWLSFKEQYEPKIHLKKSYYFSFWEFLIKSPRTNFGKFTIYRAMLSFACAISSPLVAVYLLRNLGFNYIIYTIIIFSATIFSLLVTNLWGEITDKYGNYKILIITSITIPITPVLWVLFKNPIYLIFVPSLIEGIFWTGFNLASSNFIYDNVKKQKRGIAVSYFNMLNGVGIFLGAGLGAILIKYLPSDLIEPIIAIFIISAIARLVVVLFSMSQLKEVRRTAKFHGTKDLKNIIINQMKPSLIEEARQIVSIKEYLHK